MTALQRAPIRDMTLDEVRQYMNQRVMHQVEAIDVVANTMKQAYGRHLDTGRAPGKQILKLGLMGPSGTGKTATIQEACHLLGHDKGYENHSYYVYIDASTYRDGTSVTRATGSSVGYMGCNDRNTLVDWLRGTLLNDEAREILSLKHGSKEHKTRVDDYNRRLKQGLIPKPSYITLFIDELDKAHHDFIVSLNGLLDTGRMTSSRNDTFEVPDETALLCFFTANYGAERISRMRLQDSYEGEQYALADMKRLGLQPWTIERLGRIVVYFPISRANLEEIMRAKLEDYIARGCELSRRHAAGLVYDEEVKRLLIGHVLDLAERESGIRNGVRLLFQNLNTLFQEVFDLVNSRRAELDDEGPLHVFVHRFQSNKEDLGNVIRHKLDGLLEKMTSGANRNKIAVYNERAPDATITTLGVRQDNRVLSAHVIPFITEVIDAYTEDTGRRITKLKRFKRAYKEISELVEDNEDKATIYDTIQRNKDLLGSTDSESSSDEDEGTRFRNIARKKLQPRLAAASRVEPVVTRKRKAAVVEDVTDVSEEQASTTSTEDVGVDDDGQELFACKSCGIAKPSDAFPREVTVKKVKTGESKDYQWRRNVCKDCYNEKRRNKRMLNNTKQ